MRCAETAALLTLLAGTCLDAGPLAAVHQQRYAMGTMFEVLAYHESRKEAEHAVDAALAEVVRLDRVLSHFRADSDLSTLVRDGRHDFVRVDASLYEVIGQSMRFSQRSSGRFDITIGPLVTAWRTAAAAGRAPSSREIADARQCVGYGRIQLRPPDRIRVDSDCMSIDLGGIGKGYAVDRAVGILRNAGIRHAVINAGRSSIAAIGHLPGSSGWPIQLGMTAAPITALHDVSISTSQQSLVPLAGAAGAFGEILDPATGRPAENALSITVVAASGTIADALSTTLVLMTPDEGKRLLHAFPDASAWWLSPAGTVVASQQSRRHRAGVH